MSKTLRYRLFKVGAMPPKLRDQINREQVLFFDEGVAVTIRRRGTAPGFRGGATGKFSGAFAITGRRVVATVSNTTMVDAAYDAKGDRNKAVFEYNKALQTGSNYDNAQSVAKKFIETPFDPKNMGEQAQVTPGN